LLLQNRAKKRPCAFDRAADGWRFRDGRCFVGEGCVDRLAHPVAFHLGFITVVVDRAVIDQSPVGIEQKDLGRPLGS
jgi:hypothetical protein